MARRRQKGEPLPPRVKRVSEYLSDVATMLSAKPVLEAFALSDPFTDVVVEAAKGSFTWVRFATKVYDNLKGRDAEQMLGVLCHSAYIAAVDAHVKPLLLARDIRPKPPGRSPTDSDVRFEYFTFESAHRHAFTRQAEDALVRFLQDVGIEEATVRDTVAATTRTFISNIRRILADRRFADRFGEAASLLGVGGKELRAYAALEEIAAAQIAEFTDRPMAADEPFGLAEIFVEPIAAYLPWGEVFSSTPSSKPPAVPLTEALLDRMARPETDDFILVQGPAGAGKSAFTLRLCQRLQEEGLRALRIRLRDVDPSLAVETALEDALGRRHPGLRTRGVFLDGEIFEESTVWRGKRMSRFVLILDGWDELSVGTERSFAKSIDRMLSAVSRKYAGREVPVHVIVTGRPTQAMFISQSLRRSTPVFDLEQFDPPRVRELAEKLRQALANHQGWGIPDWSRVEAMLAAYERHHRLTANRTAESDAYRIRESGEEVSESGMDILGLPLLLHLTMRIASQWTGTIEALLERPTTLYRELINVTCGTAGRAENDRQLVDRLDRVHIHGRRLRILLQATAAAITAARRESLTYGELKTWLDETDVDLVEDVHRETPDDVLTSLVVSYYFRSGNAKLGVEFLHKSFREYLFAEAVVETLVSFDRISEGGNLAHADLRPALKKWYAEVARLLAPQWMSAEVSSFLTDLLHERIASAASGQGTESRAVWIKIRDELADLWNDWAMGFYQRPKIHRFSLPRLEYLLEWCFTESDFQRNAPCSSIDACLGDGLFRLVSMVHREVALVDSLPRGAALIQLWSQLPLERQSSVLSYCQSRIEEGPLSWTMFSPAQEPLPKWPQICARINAVSDRPHGPFPLGIDCSYVDFRNARLELELELTYNGHLSFKGANFDHAQLRGSWVRVSFEEIHGRRLDASRCSFDGCTFKGAALPQSQFQRVNIRSVDFTGADLSGASFAASDIWVAKFNDANLAKAEFRNARVRDSWLSGSDRTDWITNHALFIDCLDSNPGQPVES